MTGSRRFPSWLVLLALAAGIAPTGRGPAAAVLCRKGSHVRIRDTACTKKETPLDLSAFGAVGPKGDKGDAGDKGDQGEPGPTLIAHTQNVESGFPISASPTVVAVIGDLAAATYSGSYSAALVQPAGSTYLVVNVQAHVAAVTGTGVTCGLETRADDAAWTRVAETAVSGSEAFLNVSFPSFAEGTSWSFRIVCATSGGSGTARGEIGVVAGVLVGS